MTTQLLCPCCREPLRLGSPKRYETLDEHICSPNGSSPVRSTWTCRDGVCAAGATEIFWAQDGEGPYKSYGTEVPWIDNNPVPFNSYHRAIHFQCGYHDEDRKFSLGKLTLRRAVTYKSDDHGNKTGKQVSYSWWWDGVLYRSGLRMLLFSLRKFYRSHRLGTTAAEIRHVKDAAGWPRAKWWRKAMLFWVRTFHRKAYQEATKQ